MTDRTPLWQLHQRHKARMVGFHGWEMPLNYAQGIIAEHLHTRCSCSLFDVSHMCQLHLSGGDVAAALDDVLPITATRLKPGRNKYTFACDETGGIVDDMIVGNDGESFNVVCNASRAKEVVSYFERELAGRCDMAVADGRGLLALQGPRAEEMLARLVPPCKQMSFMDSITATVCDVPCRISRTGYTGEDGFELSVPAGSCEKVAQALLDGEHCELAGLGARDTLRIEAGLCLYGNEIDASTLPAEAALEWAIPKSARSRASFIGAKAVLEQMDKGAPRKLVGLAVDGKAPVRKGAELMCDGDVVGEVTSGSHSPTLSRPIALAMVGQGHDEVGCQLQAKLRGKEVLCEIVPLPFVEHKYKTRKQS